MMLQKLNLPTKQSPKFHRYPLFKFYSQEGTPIEYTIKSPDKSGEAGVYVEEYKDTISDFACAEISFPSMKILKRSGYSDEELHEIMNKLSKFKEDIADYIIDCEKEGSDHAERI